MTGSALFTVKRLNELESGGLDCNSTEEDIIGRAEKKTRSCLYWVYCRLYITGKESDTGSHSHRIASDLCIDSPYNINGRLF